MIADVDATLQKMLLAELAERNPRWKTTPPRITLVPPALAEQDETKNGGASAAATPCVNLFLHDIRENTALREETFERIRPGTPGSDGSDKTTIGLRRAPVRLNLSYLVTAHAGGDVSTEHTLLSDVLAILLRMGQVPTRYFSGDLDVNSPLPLLVAQPDGLALQNPASLWSALGGKLRPTIGLVALATFNPFDTKWTKIVREAVLGMGQGTPNAANGSLPQRPLDLRSQRVCVAGVVTDGEGRALIKGVRVSAFPASAEGDAVRNGSRRDTENALAPPPTTTDERGFFFFLNLAPGSWRMHALKRGFVQSEHPFVVPPVGRPDLVESLVIPLTVQTDAQAAETESRDLQNVWKEAADTSPVLLHESEAARRVVVSGVLRYPDGRAAAYVPVRAQISVPRRPSSGTNGDDDGKSSSAQTRTRHTTTDNEGFYCFFDLPEAAGAFALFADVPGTGEVPLQSSGSTNPPAAPAGRRPKGERGQASSQDTNHETHAAAAAVSPAASDVTSVVPLPGSLLPV